LNRCAGKIPKLCPNDVLRERTRRILHDVRSFLKMVQ
jgi:hypothetical protein